MEVGDKIRKFFEKKKKEAKFSKAGPGHKLSSQTSKPSDGDARNVPKGPRAPPSEESMKAGIAALSRISNTNNPPRKHRPNAPTGSLGTEVQSDLREAMVSSSVGSDVLGTFAVQGIFFTCPFLGNQVLTKEEWKKEIEDFLYGQLEHEKGLTACLIIHTLNKPKEKVEICASTLCLYLENIIKNSEDPKYRKIRLENKVFKEKVSKMKGTSEFLEAAGFCKQLLENADGIEEEFFIYLPEPPEIELLEMLVDGLKNAEPISLTLDRNVQVLHPSQAISRTALPDDFFALSLEEIKREQQLKKSRVEGMMELKTKAMRQREEMNEKRKYKYVLIRVRFPNDIILQGTFNVYEKFLEVRKFVNENLSQELDIFQLFTSTGTLLDDNDAALIDLDLVPASILSFRWPTDFENHDENSYLKPDVMALLQPLS